MNRNTKLRILAVVLVIFAGSNLLFAVESPKRDPFYLEGTRYEQNFISDLPNEYINPYTGDLSLTQTDIYLPGNAGLDLRIQRYYDSHLYMIMGSNKTLSGLTEMSPLGFGWTMHMGRIENVEGDGSSLEFLPVVVMPDGSKHPLYKDKDNADQLISRELWKFKRISPAINPGKWELTLTNGAKYYFEYKTDPVSPCGHFMHTMADPNTVVEDPFKLVAQLTEIRDTHGNAITVSYVKLSDAGVFLRVPKISKITDSCGRELDFEYFAVNDQNFIGLLKTITIKLEPLGGKNAVYTYNYEHNSNGVYLNLLTSVDYPESLKWRYEYYVDNNITFKYKGNDLLLKKMTYPTGGEVWYEYDEKVFSTGKVQDNSTQYSYYGAIFKVLNKKTVTGRAVPTGEYNYDYFSVMPDTGIAFDGYDTTTITYPDNIQEKYYFYGWGATKPTKVVNQSTEYQYCDTLWKLGTILKKETIKNGTIYATEDNEYQSSAASISNAPTELLSGIITQQNTYNSLPLYKTISFASTQYRISYEDYDSYGNPKRVIETGNNFIQRKGNYEYNNNVSANILGAITRVETKVGNEIFVSTYTYNTSGDMLTNSQYGITATYDYYADGNLQKETNARGFSTKYENYQYGKPKKINYGADNQGNNPVYWVLQDIDPAGTVASVTNGRSYTMSYQYDNLNRLTKITPPNDNPKEYNSIINYTVDGSTKTVTKGTGQNTFAISYFFDGLGRNIGSFNENINMRTKVAYDAVGNKIYNSYPYNSVEHGEYFTYDPLGRVTQVTKPVKSDGTGFGTLYNIKFNYNDSTNSVTITNENSKNTAYYYESFGDPKEKRLMQVKNYVTDPQTGNLSEQNTIYSYNAVGSLVSVQLPGEDRTYTYNTQNQLVTEDALAKGTTQYTYDEIGNVKTKTDANTLVTTYTYDPLDRLHTIDYSNSDDYDVTYEYDKADNRIAEQNSYTAYSSDYNAMNKILYSSATVMGITYSTSYDYNRQGLVVKLTYPNGRIINYEYDQGNRLTAAKPFVTQASYHPSGKIGSITFKNNKTQSYAYDDLYRVYTIQSPQVIALTHTYDGRSNLTKITDNTNNQGFNFYYDDLDRIVSGTGTWKIANNAISALSYSYDQLGNRVSKNMNKNNDNEFTEYNYDNKKRLISYAGAENSSYQYDNTGNITQNGVQQYQLSPTGKIKKTSDNITLNYAPNNLRVSESTPVGASGYHSVYHYDLAGNLISETNDQGKLIRDYVYLNGMPIARITEDKVDLAIFPEEITFSENPVPIIPSTTITISAIVEDIGGEPNTQDTSVGFYDGYPSTSTFIDNKPVSQKGIIDQNNQDAKTGQWRVPQRTANRVYACQSFVPDFNGLLSKVSLYLARVNKGTDLYTLQIKRDEFDSTGHFISTGTIYTNNMIYSSAATIDVFKWIDIGIDKEVMLTKGNKYWIVLYPTMIGWIDRGILMWGLNNNKYGSGEAGWGSSENFPGGGWGLSAMIKDDTKDMMFKTYIMVSEAKIDYTPTDPGVHTIYTWVDPDNTIAEIDEKNNLACNYLFTDPTFIQANRRDINALEEFLNGESEANYEK